MYTPSKIEIAKALKAISSVSSKNQIEKIINLFSESEDDKIYFERAIRGLSEEDEFALLTRLMNTATSIIGLEQRPILEGEYIIPDFFVSFKPHCTIKRKSNDDFKEYKCLVEVKSTGRDKFKLGGSQLQKLRNTADKIGLPLIIAVRFINFQEHALWAFIKDDRNTTSINVTYNDCIKGVRHILWDEYGILLNPTLTVIMEFHTNSVKNTVAHKDYGRQEKLILRTSEKEIIIEKIEIQVLYSAFLECFNLKAKAEERVSDTVYLQYLTPEISLTTLADIVYRINNIATNEDGTTYYDASRILVRLDSKENMLLFGREYIESVFMDFLEQELAFFAGINSVSDHLAKWKEFGEIK